MHAVFRCGLLLQMLHVCWALGQTVPACACNGQVHSRHDAASCQIYLDNSLFKLSSPPSVQSISAVIACVSIVPSTDVVAAVDDQTKLTTLVIVGVLC